MKSDTGIAIARRMRKMKLDLISLGISKGLAEEVAFHIADVQVDFDRINSIMQSASGKRRFTKKLVMELHDIWAYHARYHTMNLHRALRKAVKRFE